MTSRTGGDASRRDQVKRFRALLDDEREAAALYRGLADQSTGDRRAIFAELADVEDRHAEHWAGKLEALGETVLPASGHRVGLRTRVLTVLARWFSPGAVLPLIERAERADALKYAGEPEAASGMDLDERTHARVLARIGPDAGGAGIVRGERWHRGDRSGSLRAAVFGVNDGLVSNTALVMGFAGSTGNAETILFAGLAGLLAGAFSMGAGEYVSVSSQREMFEREISLEREEIMEMPEGEQAELALIYRAKGLPQAEAEQLAARLMTDRQAALDTMAREELGLDPNELGSPWRVALSSFTAFAAGAVVVVLPYLVAEGTAALTAAIGLAVAALLAVGGSIGVLTGRSALRGALRQLLVGALAAAATYVVGALIGVGVA
ncbi:MAG: VIT1/CCC1 transporter family protein [Actinomycetes bacterium]